MSLTKRPVGPKSSLMTAVLALFLSTLLSGVPPARAAGGCLSKALFEVQVEAIYSQLTTMSDWSGHPSPVYFKNRDRSSGIHCSSEKYASYVEFIHEKLNSPENYRDFLKKVGESTSNPESQNLLGEMKARLSAKGFRFESAQSTLEPIAFHMRLKQGIVTEEMAPLLLQNGHGQSTHIVQISYLAELVDGKFGKDAMLDFYKFMGASDYWIWSELFDSPHRSDLGNPRVISTTLQSIGLY